MGVALGGVVRRFRPALLVGLLVASCAVASESTPGPAPTALAESTSSPTSTTLPDVGWPSYLTYGWHGVDRVAGAGLSDHRQAAVERLVSDPVQWAAEDGAGGVVFRSMGDEPGLVWLPADRQPGVIDLGEGAGVVIPVVVNDGPSLLVSHLSHEATANCPQPDVVVDDVVIRDLDTGRERPLVCLYQSSDAGSSITSYGGGLFTVEHDVSLVGHTSGALRFLDLSGEEVSVEHNPFAESCAPCELDAALSPDGRLLAYAYWPTASIARAEPADGDYARAFEEWWEASKDIPTELVVLDLWTGEAVWRSETGAQASLVGFDGRFLTVAAASQRWIYDTRTGDRVGIPPAESEQAAFWTAVLTSLDAVTHDYGDAHSVAADLADLQGVDTGVVWSDGWLTLERGFWAVISGRFGSREEAAALCDGLGLPIGGCYPRYLATPETIDPEMGRGMIELRGDGLGLVDFGDSAYNAMTVFTRLFGPPLQEGASNAQPGVDWVAEWEAVDGTLWLHFVEWPYFDAVPQAPQPMPPGQVFVSYSTDSSQFATAAGIKVGSTAVELRAAYPDPRPNGGCEPDPTSQEILVDAPPDGWLRLPLIFTLDGGLEDPGTRIRRISGGSDVPSC